MGEKGEGSGGEGGGKWGERGGNWEWGTPLSTPSYLGVVRLFHLLSKGNQVLFIMW